MTGFLAVLESVGDQRLRARLSSPGRRQASERLQRKMVRLSRAVAFQLVEHLVDLQEPVVGENRSYRQVVFLQRNLCRSTPALGGESPAGRLHQDAAHRLGRHAIELGPVAPLPRGGRRVRSASGIERSSGVPLGAPRTAPRLVCPGSRSASWCLSPVVSENSITTEMAEAQLAADTAHSSSEPGVAIEDQDAGILRFVQALQHGIAFQFLTPIWCQLAPNGNCGSSPRPRRVRLQGRADRRLPRHAGKTTHCRISERTETGCTPASTWNPSSPDVVSVRAKSEIVSETSLAVPQWGPP